jgi:hypothetical protein
MNALSATNSSLERRRERRVPLHLPMLVRGKDRSGEIFEERTSSVNLCRGGAAFATRVALELGSHVEIIIPVPPAPGQSDAEFATQGRVVHFSSGTQERERIVGVMFTGPRFNRMFVSEST